MVVLDTSVLVDLLRNDARAIAANGEWVARAEPRLVPAAAAFELAVEFGRRETTFSRADRILAMLRSLTVMPFDRETAIEAGRIAGHLLDKGRPIGDVDCMIAASATLIGEPLVTGNRRHFANIPRLRIQTY